MTNNSDVCGPPKFLRFVYRLSSENPAVYGLSPVLSAVRVGEITVTVINNRNFSRSLKLVSLINCARCEICKFYFFSFERKCLITSSLVIFKHCSFFRMIICSSNMSGPNLFFFAAVAIPQSEKHRSDG